MDNVSKTTDHGFQHDLPPIQSSSVQHFYMTSKGSDPNCDNQPGSIVLIDDNGSNINPGLVDLPTYALNANQTYSADTTESQNDAQAMIFTQQLDITKSKKIQMKFQPRETYHPRTLKESEKVAHYIRCDEGEEVEYPTIYTICEWKVESKRNFIEIALVDISEQLHPYTISNKEIYTTEGEPSFLKANDMAPNRLYFFVTDKDFNDGCKTFKIELIKSKQGGSITKNSIRERQLEKSKLRFTRTFYDEYGVYHRDEATTAYSRVMTEKSGDLHVDCINPTFGPMGGNQLLTVVFTGLKAQDRGKLSFEIAELMSGWKFKITEFNSVGNTICFSMPGFPHTSNDNTMTSVIVYYQGDAIYESPFLYVPVLDPILNDFSLNEPKQIDTNSTTSSNKSGLNQDSTDSSCSSSTVSKKSPKKNSKKRPHED